MRGRVGRGLPPSRYILVDGSTDPKAARWLDVLVHTTDGFQIAEADLRFADPLRDLDLLARAR